MAELNLNSLMDDIMPKKTRHEYETEIKKLHHTIKEYGDIPEVEKLKATLNRKLGKWVELLDIYITVARNEQTPWQSEELGFKTKPMFLKKDIGIDQTGDYAIFVNGTGKPLKDSFSSLLVERKGCTYERDEKSGCLTMVGCDLYSTVMNKAGRNKFYREIDRYKADTRFDRMDVFVECTREQFLQFKPPFKWVYDPKLEKKVKQYNKGDHFGATVESRIATLNGLFERGVSVRFMGSRERAIEAYRSAVRLNVIGCYERFIDVKEEQWDDSEEDEWYHPQPPY